MTATIGRMAAQWTAHDRLNSYRDLLGRIPPPGKGCHPFLMRVAHAGMRCQHTQGQIFEDIRGAIPVGTREVPDAEITTAIQKVFRGDNTLTEKKLYEQRRKPQRAPTVLPDYLKRVISRGLWITEATLRAKSPVRLPDAPESHADVFLCELYDNEEFIFLGNRYDKCPRQVSEWKKIISHSGMEKLPHIIPNPLTGKYGKTQEGAPSMRCDDCVTSFRFILVESDSLSRTDQIAFWATIPLPIVALIDSGGKSIHGWIRVHGINNLDEWNQVVKEEFYGGILRQLGMDCACSNASRLSRLPGHFRTEKDQFQRLLYLNPSPSTSSIVS
ncbi:MAG: hypothetical protein LBF26_00555 [Puniceicoccales bacterium]|jgi:hypothetical protein|nr:hypothetical protein [Puniceicoccales bacterium]